MKITRRRKIIIFCLFLAMLAVAFGSLFCGQIPLSVDSVLAVLRDKTGIFGTSSLLASPEEEAVIWYIRMPRTITAILVGAALATSGAVMQGVFGNPLAEPGIIGVSSGAATGAVLAIALGVVSASMWTMPLFAFVGALFAVSLTVMLSMRHGRIPVMTLLLAGVAVGMLLGALTSGILTFMNEQKLQQYLFWIIGGLDYRRWEHVYLAIGPITVGITMMILLARHLNILVLGDTEAKAVGMPVMFYRMLLLFLAAMTTATSVCISGNIGFVGLVVPHMMRMLVGPDHRILLPASALAGALFLVFCDALGRIIIAPTEIRVGIMTALVGSPYFLYLLRSLKREA